MRLRVAVYYIGLLVALIGIFELISVTVGWIYHESSVLDLLYSGVLMVAVGFLPKFMFKTAPDLREREAIFVVAGAWLFGGLAGAVPYILYGFPVVDAVFESVSGLTTTGSSIIAVVEDMPKWLIFWRAMTHWIGGIGVIGIMLAILPIYGKVSHDLLKQEYTSLTGTVLPRAKDVARVLLTVFVGLTVLMILVLLAMGIDWFDTVTTTFACIATGGFSGHSESIAYFKSAPVEMVVTLFTFVSGLNFVFMYGLIFPRRVRSGGWETARFFALYVLSWTLIATVALHNSNYTSWWACFRYSLFQVVTCATSTGFATDNSAVWAWGGQLALIVVSLTGGCAGSTSGGMKIDRIIMFFKLLAIRLKKIVHPNAVVIPQVDGRVIVIDQAQDAMLFLVLYLAVVMVASLALAMVGVPLLDAFSGTVATMGNVGPGLGTVGSMGNYASLPATAKVILTVVMLVGRIEIYAYFLIFTRYFWRK